MKTQIRHLIAGALYQVKSYALPSVCERYGLAPGTDSEAFSSKTRYVMMRLEKLSDQKVFELAKQVVEDYPNDELRAALEKIEQDRLLVSDITRDHIAKALDEFSLSGNLGSAKDLVGKFWPLYLQVEVFSQLFSTNRPTAPQKMSNSAMLRQAGFMSSSQQVLFDFLSEVLHPRRRDGKDQEKIIAKLNPILERDGYRFVESDGVSGYPTYKIAHVRSLGQPADKLISDVLSAFDSDGVHLAWMKALDRRDSDPEGAITAARSLLETVCKHILDGSNVQYGSGEDLPKLYAITAEHLNLAPSQHTQIIFKAILGNCQAVVSSIAGLRNKLGDSHGQGRGHVKPMPRHAELAVNLAGSMATFLIRTWEARKGA